jgi:PAS domain S-box-containing protein
MSNSDSHCSEVAPGKIPAPDSVEKDVEPRLTKISEREQTEDALRQSEKLFAAFMDHLPGFAWMKDIDGRYVYVNEKASRLNPYGAGAIGKTDEEIWPAEIAYAYRANDDQVITTRKAVQTPEPYLLDGKQCHGLVSKFPILDHDGSVVMVGGVSVDITGRIEAEEALKAQALRYKTLMETSTDSIYVVDTKGDLQEANAAFLRRRGYTAAEVKGLNVADWEARWNREELQERMRKLVGSSAVFETQHRCKDGSVFDVEVCATSVRIGGEQLFFVITRDITQRKQTEQARHESEERFRQIAENIDEVFWIWTATPGNPRLLYVSPAYEKIWGRSCESLYSSPQSWKEALHPSDKGWVLAEIAGLDLEKMNDLTYRIVRPDHSIRWIRDRIFPVRDEKGVVVRLAGIAEDITESKLAADIVRQSEAKFRQLLGSNIVGVVFWTLQGEIIDANDLFLRMVGYSREDLREGNLDWREMTPPEFAPADEKAIDQLLATGTCAPFEKEYIRKDGRRVSVLIGSALLDIANGNGSSFIMDITERKEGEAALKKVNRQLRILSRQRIQVQEDERRRLSRELHDQIGQLLTAGNLNLQSARKSRNRQAIQKKLDETIDILEQILQNARQISFDIRPPVLDDLGLAPALRWMLDDSAARAGLNSKFFADPNLRRADVESETACYRVASEAVSNVVRHAQAGKVWVELLNAGNALQLLVRDDGIGFDVGDAEKRVARNRLGLVGMRERATTVGGQFECKSAPGHGTEVRALFPISSERDRIESS